MSDEIKALLSQLTDKYAHYRAKVEEYRDSPGLYERFSGLAVATDDCIKALSALTLPTELEGVVADQTALERVAGVIKDECEAFAWMSDGFWELVAAKVIRALSATKAKSGEALTSGSNNVPPGTPLNAPSVFVSPPRVPETADMVLVPREPTDAMIEAGIEALREHTQLAAIDRDPLFVWRYMLLAVPKTERDAG